MSFVFLGTFAIGPQCSHALAVLTQHPSRFLSGLKAVENIVDLCETSSRDQAFTTGFFDLILTSAL